MGAAANGASVGCATLAGAGENAVVRLQCELASDMLGEGRLRTNRPFCKVNSPLRQCLLGKWEVKAHAWSRRLISTLRVDNGCVLFAAGTFVVWRVEIGRLEERVRERSRNIASDGKVDACNELRTMRELEVDEGTLRIGSAEFAS
jgi:hypothetical protein